MGSGPMDRVFGVDDALEFGGRSSLKGIEMAVVCGGRRDQWVVVEGRRGPDSPVTLNTRYFQ
ncbi:hypothetical protein Pyn_30982 [Prunus yedoensis var. nudiflora]|uniref:Uncharacterized protein n=1 Tax=Prunus yedoensis var. nudiflora TaxID=2094558 RepID=A0A314ZC42_PRUYE|nr:hypothetical protein Pyn_30982 [Prunus yedoensis var. nudiflora]